MTVMIAQEPSTSPEIEDVTYAVAEMLADSPLGGALDDLAFAPFVDEIVADVVADLAERFERVDRALSAR